MRVLIIPLIFLFISCGERDGRCISGLEKRMECQLEEMDKTNGIQFDWQIELCENLYPEENVCY